jgi:iron complex outermembrane receptor protein
MREEAFARSLFIILRNAAGATIESSSPMRPALLALFSLAILHGSDETKPEPRRDVVVVTGSFEPMPLEEADRAVRVLDVRHLYLLANSFTDLLQLDPSLDLRQRAPNGVQADLSIRGGTFGQTLVLLNGLRLNDPQSGHHNLDLPVPLESVTRIELLKGLGSTFYGSDAVGGVVNVITQNPERSELRLRAALGNWGVNQERASYTGIFGRVTQQWSLARDFSTGFQPNRDYRNLSFSSSTHAASRLGATDVLLAYNDRPFGADQFYGNFNSWERTKSWFAALKQDLGARTEAAFAYRRHTDLFVLYRDRPEVFTNRHAVESFETSLRRHETLGTNTRLHYGAEAYRDSIVSNNLGTHSRVRTAGYVAFDVRALRRWSLSLGAREEVFRNLQGQFSPSASAGLWLSGSLRLRMSVSRAFRLPTYTDLYYHDPANVGSPNLRPEKAWNYEAGLDWNRGRFRGDATVFHRRERDGIDYVRASANDVWRATNFQRLEFTGVEASVSANLPRSQLVDLRYTGLRGSRGQLAGQFSRYVFNYPSHSAVASWQGPIPGGWFARTRLGAIQRYARDPYALWDIYVARNRGRLHPFVQLTNAANVRYEEILGVPMPGRGVVAGFDLVVFGR